MHVLFTDSGVGGLSVCAAAERFLRRRGVAEPVRLSYVNASPENDFGYNSMASRQEQLECFDRFLDIVTRTYTPDLISVACNTLSVIMQDTRFFAGAPVPMRGIVETGVDRLVQELGSAPECAVVLFGTVTTIYAGTYPRLLQERGVAGSRIISQACPGLADTISEDRQGLAAKQQIAGFVRAAVGKLDDPSTPCLAYLACTHYGYRQEHFAAAFAEAGVPALIVNPNELVVDDLFGSSSGLLLEPGDTRRSCPIAVEFVTRYRIPDTALETISFFLESISPATVRAFQHYTYAPDLF